MLKVQTYFEIYLDRELNEPVFMREKTTIQNKRP